MFEYINSPADLKKLKIEELENLACEIREEIIHVVSHNGGHLASSLGTVELTIAIHYVFDTPDDRVIWDVGHQTYTHKLLTGRKEKFHTLRQFGGISGFPKTQESCYDTFNTGHASTSISAALGMAISRDLKGDKSQIIAVIGDGALGGGLAFEALNHAGHLKKDLLVILNSNEMSISHTVGALSKYLNRLMTMPIYNRLRKEIQQLVKKIPKVGMGMVAISKQIEEGLKNIIVPGALFEELGFRYFGPINGHNLSDLIKILVRFKGIEGPKLLHIVTKKGKGYPPAEQNPEWFHGTSPFDSNTGIPIKMQNVTYSTIFGKALVRLAEVNSKIVAITAAMEEGTGLNFFAKGYPSRFFDVGIAEGHAVTLAAGVAIEGYKPVVAIYSSFLQRAYDQIIHDVCLQNLGVVFAIDRAGIVGEDGATHHGIRDLAYLRTMPNMIIMSPKNGPELAGMLQFAVAHQSPVAIRYPRGETLAIDDLSKIETIEIGKGETLLEPSDGVILTIGSMVDVAISAAGELIHCGIKVGVCNLRFVNPLDEELLLALSERVGRFITIEEGVVKGGLGSAVVEFFANKGIAVKVKLLGLPNEPLTHGNIETLLDYYGLTSSKVAQEVIKFIKEA